MLEGKTKVSKSRSFHFGTLLQLPVAEIKNKSIVGYSAAFEPQVVPFVCY